MAGLLNLQPPATAPSATAPTSGPGPQQGQITPAYIESRLHLNPQQKQQLQRIVLAGMKVMFDPQTHQLMLKQIQGPDPVAQKLGQGVAGLLGLLMKESKNSLPKQLLIPAGMVLVAQAADFMRKAKMQVSDQDIAQAIEVMARYVLKVYGVDADKVAAIGAGAAGGQGGMPTAPDDIASAGAAAQGGA